MGRSTLATVVLQGVMAKLHELIVRRLGTTLEAAASDVSIMSGPAVEQLYDQIIRILQFGLGGPDMPALLSGDRP